MNNQQPIVLTSNLDKCILKPIACVVGFYVFSPYRVHVDYYMAADQYDIDELSKFPASIGIWRVKQKL